MDRLSELGTARGHAQREVQRARKELERALAEFANRDREYRKYLADNPQPV